MLPTSLPSDRPAARTNALIEMAAGLGGSRLAGEISRRQSVLVALSCLAPFARKQLAFLQTGLGPRGRFETDTRYPLDFLSEATTRQLSFDLDVLLRALSHREVANSTPSMRETLALADQLAVRALLPAVRHGLAQPAALLTYFQKSPTIRLIPYVPLAAIGVDFSAPGDPSRLLAVAHEVGHHVYRQLTVNYAAQLDTQIEAMASPAAEGMAGRWPAWLLAWEEEIFADSYAALVAGPAAALGLQQLIATGRRTGLAEEDGVHPVDLLRPQILHTTLKLLAEQGAPGQQRSALWASVKALESTWQLQLSAASAPEAFEAGGAVIGVQEGGTQLRAFVAELLGSVLAPLLRDEAHCPWSVGAEVPSHALAASLDQFSSFCAAQAGQPLPELALDEVQQGVGVVRFPGIDWGAVRRVGEVDDATLAALRERGLAGEALQADEWKAVFLAGDWTTQEGGSGIKPPVRRMRGNSWWLTYVPPVQPPRRVVVP